MARATWHPVMLQLVHRLQSLLLHQLQSAANIRSYAYDGPMRHCSPIDSADSRLHPFPCSACSRRQQQQQEDGDQH
jgi:hypothetical protein